MNRPPSPHPRLRPSHLPDIPENFPVQTNVITNNHLYNMILELKNEIEELKKQMKN